MTTCAASSPGTGVTLVGELVHLGAAGPDGLTGHRDVSNLSVRWLGLTVHPSTAGGVPAGQSTAGGAPQSSAWPGPMWAQAGAAPAGPSPSGAWPAGPGPAGQPASYGQPARTPDAQDQPRPHGLRGLTDGIRRLIDGPQGRHRRPAGHH